MIRPRKIDFVFSEQSVKWPCAMRFIYVKNVHARGFFFRLKRVDAGPFLVCEFYKY